MEHIRGTLGDAKILLRTKDTEMEPGGIRNDQLFSFQFPGKTWVKIK